MGAQGAMVVHMSDTITLTSTRLRATIAPLGARLETLCFDGGESLVLHADTQAHPVWRDAYAGTIVGPVANRVESGRVPINGNIHQMPCNENGVTALHSGPDGLDQQIWRVLEQSQSALRLCVTLTDGHGGLPGNRKIEALYSLEDATVRLTITATTDAPTPINIAHHPYWRIGISGAHRLYINADSYLPVDERNIPTGALAPVAGTQFDHSIPKQLDRHVDHNFCCSDAQRDTPVHIATLHGAEGLMLHIDSTEPGLQVYAGANLPTLPGTDIAPFAGIALEPQGWPDAVNHPHFPAILCSADRPYRQITHYRIDRAT